MPRKTTKTWTVNLEYHSEVRVQEVEAEDKESAIKAAQEMVNSNEIGLNSSLYDARATEE